MNTKFISKHKESSVILGFQLYQKIRTNMGKTLNQEIDFTAIKKNEKVYIQVCREISSEKTEKREYSNLLNIKDNYPKYLLRTDDFSEGNYEGIKTVHIADFLLLDEF